jgi:3-oxoacyl-[acyl-carrier protein] reductase
VDFSIFSLEGKVAIVTGAGSINGMGRATAAVFADAGADVAVSDVNVTGETFDLEGAAEEVRKLGRRAIAVQADVTKESDIANLVNKTVKEFGRIDILANVAGMGVLVPFMETTREHWDKAFDINLRSQFMCTQAVAKVMMEQKKGNIINWGSFAGVKISGAFVYGMAKIGVHALTAWSAKEFAPYNIRVNAVVPGNVATGFGRHAISKFTPPPAATTGPQLSREERMKEMAKRIPVGKIAEPREIANVALFLASEASCQVTGHVLLCEGGMNLM